MKTQKNDICDKCKMRGGFVTNLPEHGKSLCFVCYIKSIHPVSRIIEILKYEHKHRPERLGWTGRVLHG